MRRTVVLYGLLGGLLIAGLKAIEYRFLVVEHSVEIYGGILNALSMTPLASIAGWSSDTRRWSWHSC